MTESFSDLWAASGPAKQQQLPLKSLAAAASASNTNGARRATPDAFSVLASASSSQPGSRPITPSAARQPPKPTPSNAGDAFGGLVSFGASNSRDGGLTIAERAAKAERERREQAQREQAALQSQGSFWDQFEGDAKPPPKSTTLKPQSNGAWDLDFLTPEPAGGLSQPAKASETKNDDDWDLDFIPSAPAVDVTPPTSNPRTDLFEIDDFAPPSREPSRTNTPGSFDFGNREDGDGDGDEDDILGSLARPVEEVRRTSPRPSPRGPSPAPSRTAHSRSSSPPPHVLGRIVEMGFSVQQAKIALAATDTGLDVDGALEILLQNGSAEPDAEGREREQARERDEEAEAEAERRRRRRQGPSRAAVPTPSTSAAPAGQQQGLQDQADKLLAQASTIGLSMFNKANAIWKEKVVKVYEEQRASSTGADAAKSTGRPRWMDESRAVGDDDEGIADKVENTRSRDNRAGSPKARPPPPQPQPRERNLLFADEAEPVYKSPARRRPPPSASPSASASASRTPSKAPSRSPTPTPVRRPTVTASSSAVAASNTHKATGTEHFKLGRFAESEAAYSSAIDALPVSHLLRVPLYNNRALTRLRTGDYKGTVEDASEAVQIIVGDAGVTWNPGREAPGDDAGVDLSAAFGKALRRRAEAYEGMEKWKEGMADWERLSAATWVGHALRGDAVKGAGRCRRTIGGATASSAPSTSRPPPPRPKPARPAAEVPSEALSRVREANATQEAEDQARHDLKDSVDARLTAWRAGKETNLRALIASLDTVLWPALGWQKVGMAELVSPGQVKVRYTKAISKLHPDKLSGNNTNVEQRMIANGVFGTLNEAWNAFR